MNGGYKTTSARGFTLIELLVVIGIIVLLAGMTVPAVKALTQGNSRRQAVNQIRAYLSQARAIAISRHTQVGVVFFEETPAHALPVNGGQVAMQIFVEYYDQSLFNPAAGNTVFVQYSTARDYLPRGIQVAALNDDPAHLVIAGSDDSPNKTRGTTRAIVFDAQGNLAVRHGLARPDLGGQPGTYPQACGDWNFTTKRGANHLGISTPGIFVFDLDELKALNIPAGPQGDSQRDQWVRQNSDVILVNANTGTFLQ